ncbi:MAG TPA: rhodanese-like domain-containing protein [Bacteroidia bacterium]|nr:rhodanese-like domain-containing protein [Bacteroidia bacterium]
MKKYTLILLPVIIFFFSFKKQDPIKKENLIQPQELANLIVNPKAVKPVIFNIGNVDQIKGAINIGALNTDEGMKKFKFEVGSLAKDKQIVVYCGCCSSDNCPNIRPAIKYLIDNGYKNAKVLNIPVGIKEDWVQKGFPVEK